MLAPPAIGGARQTSLYGLARHPERRAAARSRSFAGRSMNSPLASNGSFCGGNAADLQSKLPKTLPEQAKAQGDSRSGISNGLPIAFVRKVTFATKAIKAPREIPLTVFAFLFCCSAKQKFDCVWVVTFSRYSLTISPHSAQDDAGNRPRVFGNLLCKSVAFSHRKNSRYSPKASSCSAQDDTLFHRWSWM